MNELDPQAAATTSSVTASDARAAQRRQRFAIALAAALVMVGVAVVGRRSGRDASTVTSTSALAPFVSVANPGVADIPSEASLYLIDDPVYLVSSAAIRSVDRGFRRPTASKTWHNATSGEYLTLVVTEHLGRDPARDALDGEMIVVNGHAVRFATAGDFQMAVWLDGTRAVHVGGLRSRGALIAAVESVRIGLALGDATLTPPPGFVFTTATDESVIPAVIWDLNVEYPEIEIQIARYQTVYAGPNESDHIRVAGRDGVRRELPSPAGTVMRFVGWEAEPATWITLSSETMTTEELVRVADTVTRVDTTRFLEAVGRPCSASMPTERRSRTRSFRRVGSDLFE